MGVHSTIKISRSKAMELIGKRLGDPKWVDRWASEVLEDISFHNCYVVADGEPNDDIKVDEDIAYAKQEGKW